MPCCGLSERQRRDHHARQIVRDKFLDRQLQQPIPAGQPHGRRFFERQEARAAEVRRVPYAVVKLAVGALENIDPRLVSGRDKTRADPPSRSFQQAGGTHRANRCRTHRARSLVVFSSGTSASRIMRSASASPPSTRRITPRKLRHHTVQSGGHAAIAQGHWFLGLQFVDRKSQHVLAEVENHLALLSKRTVGRTLEKRRGLGRALGNRERDALAAGKRPPSGSLVARWGRAAIASQRR